MNVKHIPIYTAILLVASSALFAVSSAVTYISPLLRDGLIALGAIVLLCTYVVFIFTQNRELFVSIPRALEIDPANGEWVVKIVPNIMDKLKFHAYIRTLTLSPSDDLQVTGVYDSGEMLRSNVSGSRLSYEVNRFWNFGSFVKVEGSRKLEGNDAHSLTFRVEYRKTFSSSEKTRWALDFTEEHTIR